MDKSCIGLYNPHNLECLKCEYIRKCIEIQFKILRGQKSIRYKGKYKGRGKEKRKGII